MYYIQLLEIIGPLSAGTWWALGAAAWAKKFPISLLFLMHQVYGKVSGTQNMCHIFARTGHGQAVQGRRFQYLIVKIVNDLFFWKSINFGDKNDMIW
jgi:hypothetical protein